MDSQTQGTGASAQPRQSKKKAFLIKSIPYIFIVVSLIILILTIVACIMNFIDIVVQPSAVLLNIYCMLFSFIAFAAELRVFSILRKIVYYLFRHMYFLTSYRARGAFYVLFGLLLLGNKPLLYVAGAFAIVMGLAMMILTVFVPLPHFEDAKEAQRRQADYQRYREQGPPSALGFVGDLRAKLGIQQQQQQQPGAQGGFGGSVSSSVPYAAQASAPGGYVAPPVATTETAREGSDADDAPPTPPPPRQDTSVTRPAAKLSEESVTKRNFKAAMADGYSSEEY